MATNPEESRRALWLFNPDFQPQNISIKGNGAPQVTNDDVSLEQSLDRNRCAQHASPSLEKSDSCLTMSKNKLPARGCHQSIDKFLQ